MKFPAIGFVVLGAVLSCPLWLSGHPSQSPTTPAPAAIASEEHYPDQGFLSLTRYTNRYFGFAFDLPPEARLQPIPEPATTGNRIQVLQLGGPPSADAAISIAALPITGKNGSDAKAVLRHDLDQELFIGVEELHGLTKTMLAGRQFYFYETRRGIDQHVELATNVNSYVVVFLLASRNDKILKQLESSFRQVTFFPSAESRQQAGAGAKEYEGPAISAHRLAQLKADPPSSHIDPGHVKGGAYENPTLGFLYRIPTGWTLQPEGAVEPAFERENNKPDLFEPTTGHAEHELKKVCDRMLFSAWAKRPEADGQIPYDDFGEVTVSATPAPCFAGVKFPTDSTDREAVKDFLLQFGLTHPILREMRDAKAFSSGGSVFIFLHGTVALKVSDDALTRRLSIGMSITQRRGYLLTWFFAAPHDAEMNDLLEQRVAFDPGPPIKESDGAKPGGGAPSAAASALPAAPSPAAGAPAALPAQQGTEPAASQTTASPNASEPATPTDAAQESGDPAADSSSKPTLLRPGETMQDQQMGGKPVPKHPKK